MGEVVVAAKAWEVEKKRHPEMAPRRPMFLHPPPTGGWLQPPPASVVTDDVPPEAKLSDGERALLTADAWDALDGFDRDILVLRMAVMQHLAEFGAAPADLVADASQSGPVRGILGSTRTRVESNGLPVLGAPSVEA